MTEHQEQVALFTRAKYNEITREYMYAVENGGTRHPLEALNIKKRGVKAGIPDIFLAYPSGIFHGLYIEMKHPAPRKGVLSPDQVMWLERLGKIGYATHVAYGCDDAWNKICEYLKIEVKP